MKFETVSGMVESYIFPPWVMRKTNIDLYLEKVAAGDRSYVDKLCHQLADRLLIVPVEDPSGNASSRRGREKVRVLRLEDGTRSVIPVFTSKQFYAEWKKNGGAAASDISLFGADLCLALDSGTWLCINPGDENSIELEPEHSETIASVQSSSEPITATVQPEPAAVAPDVAARSPARRPVSPTVHPPKEGGSADPGRDEDAVPPPLKRKRKKSLLNFLGKGN